ncbi:MAG: GBS Bsp-like repeat-containing protein [Candidatus Pacebacteria bacterium]|nr:GBS Bsp-like repeat-containing protein [Candidatus Paceibacterota bacterium]
MDKIKRAFTLIELIIIIAVMGILVSFVIFSINGATSSAANAKRKSEVDTIYKALVAKGTELSYPEGTFEINDSSPQEFKDFISQYLKTIPNDPVSTRSYLYTSNGSNFSVAAMLDDGSCFVKSSKDNLFTSDACSKYAEGGLGFVNNLMILHGGQYYDLFYSINSKYSASPVIDISTAIVCKEESVELTVLPTTNQLLSSGMLMGIVDDKEDKFRVSLASLEDKDKWYYCQALSYSEVILTNPGNPGEGPNTASSGFSEETKYAVDTPTSVSGGINASDPVVNPYSPAGGEAVGSTTPNFTLSPQSNGSIIINWVKGYASTDTIIRRQIGTPPNTIAQGAVIYDGPDSTYTDSGLSPDTYYCYSAWGYDSRTDKYSLGFAFACGSVPPSDPSGLTIGRHVSSLEISFIKGSGNASIIRRKTGSAPVDFNDGEQVYLGEGSNYSDSVGLSPNNTYCYSVWSYNTSTATSSLNKATVCSELFPVGNPTNLVLSNTTYDRIDLSWNTGERSTKTVIRRLIDTAPTDRTQGTEVYSSNGTTYSDINLSSETKYCYTAWDYNETADAYSEIPVSSCSTTLALAGAESQTSTVNDTNIILNFTKGIGSTNTIIRRQSNTAPTTRSQGVEVYNGTGTTHTDTGLNPSAKYCYSYWAFNSTTNSYSSPSSICYDTKPSDVTGLIASNVTYNSLTLSWTKGSGSTNTIIRGQTDTAPVERTDGAEKYNSTGVTVSLTGLVQGTTYCYSAWSYNGTDYSTSKASICSVLPVVGVPQDISSSTVTNNSLTLSWTKGSGASNTVIRRQLDSAPTDRSQGTEVYSGTSSSINETGLNFSANYCYSLWGYDNATDSYSPTYNFYCITTLTPVNGSCPATSNSYTTPTATCVTGNPSSLSGTGPWTWTCAGVNGGTTSGTCTVNKSVDGTCGSTNNSCTTGTLSDTADGTTTYDWSCLGSNGGSNPACTIAKAYASSSGPSGNPTTYKATYDVYVYGVGNATAVTFPTWTNANGQDDLKWYTGTDLGGGTWKATINMPTYHGNEFGQYNVHIYGYDAVGSVYLGAASFIRANDCISGGGLTCTRTYTGSYAVNTYTTNVGTTTGSYTWTVPSGVTQVEYLVVGGGGGGGSGVGSADNRGGGGGGGGFLTGTVAVSGAVTVTVGRGGPIASAGSNSVFGSIVAYGGGGGGSGPGAGGAGGSGGGGGASSGAAYYGAGSGSSGQGYAGGTGGSDNVNFRIGGGGGGAGEAGYPAANNNTTSGNGGAGRASSITGTSTYYAGGGGAGGVHKAYGVNTVGGVGGGGSPINYNGQPGTNGLGGGGSGSGNTIDGTLGGSGVVIIRYVAP